ncbi:hypothetical protein EUX98_g5562 [Antrodiella citrinella]|uniref:DUF6535 domain-containing protein n=1 Tax=Antrodiella citrinella TaxID=2447956 RepID=A0A4S4MR45_9APHY|nr:hypothetical protein EUX98_g5562 [Antrodiella citrinella]
MSRYLRDYDEERVKDSKEDIDTLLVFAGLFSAVLTAFIIVSYALLQPDTSTLTVQLLAQISMQLSAGGVGMNGTLPLISASNASFQPPASALRINGLWFASLTFSLITASLGMLVKQWLREYMAGEMISAKERCRVRHFRNRGIVRWRVFEIAAFLPMLLQLSLILFFVGMLDFIRLADSTLCWIIASIVSLYLLFYASTTVSPIFSARSPFKTPLLKPVFSAVRNLLKQTKLYFTRHFLHVTDYAIPFEEHQMRKRNDLDVEMIMAADATFMDPQFFDNVQLCVRDLESTTIITCVRLLMEQRVGSPLASLRTAEFAFWRLSYSERLTAVSMLFDTVHAPLLAALEGRRKSLHWAPWMDEAMFGLYMSIRANLDLGSRTVSPPALMTMLLSYKVEFAEHLLVTLCETRMITHLFMPNKRLRYLPLSLPPEALDNMFAAATRLFTTKECKPIELWTLLLRFLKNLPDDILYQSEIELHHFTEIVAQAITEDIPNCDFHRHLHLQVLASGETKFLANRIHPAVSSSLIFALQDDQWDGPRQALERRGATKDWGHLTGHMEQHKYVHLPESTVRVLTSRYSVV